MLSVGYVIFRSVMLNSKIICVKHNDNDNERIMTDKIIENSMDIRVRYPEVDQMGVVHHSRYWQYFEMGRIELLRKQGFSYAELEKMGVLIVVAKASIRYHAPARFDDVIAVTTRIKKVGAARIDHEYEVKLKDTGTLVATAETTVASVDRDGSLTPLPDFLRE